MAGISRNEPMTADEMIEAGKQKRATSRIYKAEADEIKDEAISTSIANALNQLRRAEGRGKISLDDTATVKTFAEAYLESCAVSSCFPSMSGFALAMGHTRNSLYNYMEKKSETETGKFLMQLHDLFAQILSENSLKNNSNGIVSIFLLKSLFGYKETQSIELVNGSRIDEEPTLDELAQRAGLLTD